MTALFAPIARLPDTWASNVRIEIGPGGIIDKLVPNSGGQGAELLAGPVIPGMTNLHSHAFQRAMVGLAECRGDNDDDFWSWREAMYRFLAFLEPSDVEAIAMQLYVEMVKAGYTRVCEFHYLHKDPKGAPYREREIMALAHLRAAENTGIAITLLPTLYTSGGCGGKPLKSTQKRFKITPDHLVEMIHSLERAASEAPDAAVGIGLHSLRAARPAEMKQVLDAFPDKPVHIHVSEQPKEVEECMAWSGRTPIAVLQREFGLGKKWNLVHATHITDQEIDMVAGSGANVALCPTTEGNLGDGLFPADKYFSKTGRFGIGTDSQVSIDPREELRLFEYGRRLGSGRRVRSVDRDNSHSGAWLWLHAAAGGNIVSGASAGKLQKGCRADFLVIDDQSVSIVQRQGDALLDAFVFASHGSNPVKDVWVGGKRVVKDGHSPVENEAAAAFRRTMDRWKTAA